MLSSPEHSGAAINTELVRIIIDKKVQELNAVKHELEQQCIIATEVREKVELDYKKNYGNKMVHLLAQKFLEVETRHQELEKAWEDRMNELEWEYQVKQLELELEYQGKMGHHRIPPEDEAGI